MAQMCDLARDYNIAVDIEFMPFRPVKTFTDALGVVRRADRPNAHIMVDALHVFRSNSSLDDIRKADRRFLGTFQICDAPRDPPPADQLATEARTRRLLPGHGGLPLWELIDALPADIPVGVELPIASQFPQLDPQARMQLMARSTREFYASRRNREQTSSADKRPQPEHAGHPRAAHLRFHHARRREKMCHDRAKQVGLTLSCRQSNSSRRSSSGPRRQQRRWHHHQSGGLHAHVGRHPRCAQHDQGADIRAAHIEPAQARTLPPPLYITFAATALICGLGVNGYPIAVEAMAELIKARQAAK